MRLSVIGFLALLGVFPSDAGAQFLTNHLEVASPAKPLLSSPPGGPTLPTKKMDAPNAIALSRLVNELEAQDSVTETGSISRKPEECLNAENAGQGPIRALSAEIAKILRPALELTGRCSAKYKDLAEDIARGLRTRLGSPPQIQIHKEDKKLASTDDWVAVDLIARSLYGELGGKPRCAKDLTHFRAVGKTMMNRDEFMHSDRPGDPTNFYKANSQVKNKIALVAINPEEFQVWDPDKKTSVGRWLACPGSKVGQVYRDGDGDVQSSVGFEDVQRWEKAVQVASEMVFKPSEFRCATKEVRGIFYSKGDYPPGQNFVKVGAPVRIEGRALDTRECVELWENPKNKFRSQTPDC